ncbi:helix-turn-helix transcriptional regulator [Streptomyces sp. NBC_01446]|uniref:helix-turn-helix domain-containing protein n=1 Tax=Streptomyces sp. NBC_01446 TaxID=2903870 RepID=UPI002253BA03|nr:helix-turn-helix transcriptional regulator [Streptomyces sp. NBC_01446]MCX4643194.1 helix-turn-helix domain-containing protein [Streptomyces sp. NBC_01446]
MPSLGSISATCAPEATEEVQAFANALKVLIHHVRPGHTMAQKAKALHVSPPLLSHWLNGRRLPRSATIGELSGLALGAVTGNRDIAALAHEFAALESLLQAARRSVCRRCASGCTCSETESKGYRRNSSCNAPTDEGYRRNSATPPNPDLPAHLTTMTEADRKTHLRDLGSALSEGDVGVYADILARAGMKTEMEVLLRSAESAGRDSMEIAIILGRLR